MKQLRNTAFLLIVLLTGCAGIGLPGLGNLPNLSLKGAATEDLDAAIASAQVASDPMAPQRVVCYQTIKALLPELPPIALPAPAKAFGVFSAFEQAAQIAEAADGVTGFAVAPDARVRLAVDCGPLQVRAKGMLARLGLKVAGWF